MGFSIDHTRTLKFKKNAIPDTYWDSILQEDRGLLLLQAII